MNRIEKARELAKIGVEATIENLKKAIEQVKNNSEEVINDLKAGIKELTGDLQNADELDLEKYVEKYIGANGRIYQDLWDDCMGLLHNGIYSIHNDNDANFGLGNLLKTIKELRGDDDEK